MSLAFVFSKSFIGSMFATVSLLASRLL